MHLKLDKVLSALTLFSAWAYGVGWLKTFFFYNAFGIGLKSLNYSAQDYLFESWYVIENLLFFALLLVTAAIARKLWVWVVFAAYLGLPLLKQWSFSYRGRFLADWYLSHDHSVLKFTPFVVLLILLFFDRPVRTRLIAFDWSYSQGMTIVLAIVVIAWSISAAKHFGASNADEILVAPADHLARVQLHMTSDILYKELDGQFGYLLFLNSTDCIILNNGQSGQNGSTFRVLDIPRSKIRWIDASMKWQKPGLLFF